MNKKQLIAIWIAFFIFSLVTTIYIILINDQSDSFFTQQYINNLLEKRISPRTLEFDPVYLASMKRFALINQFVIFSFFIINITIFLLYFLRSKNKSGEK